MFSTFNIIFFFFFFLGKAFYCGLAGLLGVSFPASFQFEVSLKNSNFIFMSWIYLLGAFISLSLSCLSCLTMSGRSFMLLSLEVIPVGFVLFEGNIEVLCCASVFRFAHLESIGVFFFLACSILLSSLNRGVHNTQGSATL